MPAVDYIPAQPSMLQKGQVFALAESVAAQLGYTPSEDIRALIERIGGSVSVEDTLTTDPDSSGSLYVDSSDKFSIIVPAHTSPKRDRFTIAHEFGHFIVHYMWRRRAEPNMPSRMVAYRRGSERVEWEANWFAAAFLMPEAGFRQQFEMLDGNIADLAAAFNVSDAAAEIRAKQLGLT